MTPLYLPYYQQPQWTIGPVTIHAFGVMVALALVVGTLVARWHGKQRGQDPVVVTDLVTWTCVGGFVLAHLVSLLFYFPERVLEDPLQLFYFWNGLSSFGGFLGAALGGYVFLKRRGLPLLPYYDSLAVGLAPGWILGRFGCTLAHDHPGTSTTFFLAFDSPDRGPIHDLGFYEFLFAIVLTGIVLVVRRRQWPAGAIPAMMAVLYAPVRFLLDFLRVEDTRYSPVLFFLGRAGEHRPGSVPWWYLDFTPGQWLAVFLLVFGIWLWVHAWRRKVSPFAAGSAGRKCAAAVPVYAPRRGLDRRWPGLGVCLDTHQGSREWCLIVPRGLLRRSGSLRAPDLIASGAPLAQDAHDLGLDAASGQLSDRVHTQSLPDPAAGRTQLSFEAGFPAVPCRDTSCRRG
jgi:phosphatidylglycerol---prolipoprotein diacylglyceryl transferase